jgi:hypothetical protein
MFWTVGILILIDGVHWFKEENKENYQSKSFLIDFLRYSSFVPYYLIYLNLAVLFSAQYATFN